MNNNYFRHIAGLLCVAIALLSFGCSTSPQGGQGQGSGSGQGGNTSYQTPQNATGQQQGMSTRNKVVLLAGAALLYYLYKKHQAEQQASGNMTGGHPQLYRSRNGGVYYRDAQGHPVWLTVPNQGVEVPQNEVQQYAPDYQSYQGSAPPAPAGAQTQSFNQYDPSAMAGTNNQM